MRDQVAAAQRAGLTAMTINSANADEWGQINAALAAGEVDLLLVSPERLNNPRFRDEQLPQLADAAGLLVVDEAHCISDWGHDFRPDYRRIRDLLVSMPVGRPVLATTATANQRVVDDVEEQLEAGGAEVRTYRGSLSRKSLRLGVLPLPTPEAPYSNASGRAFANAISSLTLSTPSVGVTTRIFGIEPISTMGAKSVWKFAPLFGISVVLIVAAIVASSSV